MGRREDWGSYCTMSKMSFLMVRDGMRSCYFHMCAYMSMCLLVGMVLLVTFWDVDVSFWLQHMQLESQCHFD